MYAAVSVLDIFLALLLAGAWAVAALTVDRLGSPHWRGGRRLAWLALALIGGGLLLSLARVGTGLGLWAFNWWFAHDRVTLALPLLIAPAALTIVLTLPRLLLVGAGRATEQRRTLSHPATVAPVQATAVGAVLGAWLALSPPYPPYGSLRLVLGTVLVAALGLFWGRQHLRRRALGRATPPLARRVGFGAVRVGATVLVLIGGFGVWFAAESRASQLPDRYSMMDHGPVDLGGGPELAHEHGLGTGGVSLTELGGPRTGEPDARFTLTAQATRLRLASGAEIDAWTFDGQAPGPELRVRAGDLVEVTLRNELPEAYVTLHWHGLDVPNAEDGVAGVTQDAVRPGGQHVYRFVPEQVGAFWYHSHQVSSEQVRKGLFGTLVVLPREGLADGTHDVAVVAHTWETVGGDRRGVIAFGSNDGTERQPVAPGTPVRLRLVNSDNTPTTFSLTGTSFQVAAIDGTELHGPTDLDRAQLKLAGGGRYDLTFTMPDGPVWLGLPGERRAESDLGLLLSPDGTGEPLPLPSGDEFDPLTYGSPTETPFDAGSDFDREFTQMLDNQWLGAFFDGGPAFFTINGEVFPETPTLMVQEGELITITIVNRSLVDHPMHLHGHHVLVLSRDGEAATGSPWWSDTLNVGPGEIYEVAFLADNPGLWMDHCHNLDHAAQGMTMHLAYAGVTTPFEAGEATGKTPE